MNLRVARLTVVGGFAAMLAAATAACSYLPRAQEADVQAAAPPMRPAPPGPAPLRIVQLSFGRNAYFASCAEPACPSLTPKTLPGAVTQPVAAAAPTRAASVPASASGANSADTHILLSFPFGSASLTPEARQTLRRSLHLAAESNRIFIAGRTDSVGADDINQQLALARALAVRNFIRHAVPDLPDVIAIDAKGRCCFIAPNDDEAGRSRNRRVEVVFTSSGVM